MERRRSDGGYIKKGPWTAEEDEILMTFVNKNGPRDWSSIRSKSLLPRAGKSCRLRWVNKLRPNLKTSKFTAEEERVVIELQGQFGNKWAQIATYLPGRTDNDVKNFWSTRRKRLEKKKEKDKKIEVSDKSSSMALPLPCNSVSHSGNNKLEELEMVTLPDLPTVFDAFDGTVNLRVSELPYWSFSSSAAAGVHFSATVLGADQFLLDKFEDVIGTCKAPEMMLMESPSTPDSFFDDFPADMFDYLEPIQPSGS